MSQLTILIALGHGKTTSVTNFFFSFTIRIIHKLRNNQFKAMMLGVTMTQKIGKKLPYLTLIQKVRCESGLGTQVVTFTAFLFFFFSFWSSDNALFG